MLDYKFRAWHKANKEMVYFDMHKVKNDQYQAGYLASLMAGDYGDVLMMGSGFEDRTGKEIYEGDYLIDPNFPLKRHLIVRIAGGFYYELMGGLEPLHNILSNGLLKDIEVCGNKWEKSL